MSCDLEDIEDFSGDAPERVDHSMVIPKKIKDLKEKPEGKIPHTESIYVKTWGCSHNNSDGEYMAGQLAVAGYKITENRDEADLWLLNSCTVKDPSQLSFLNEIKKGQDNGKSVVVAGCVPQAQPKHKDFSKLSVIGVQQIDRVVEVVEQTLEGNSIQLLGTKKGGGASLDLPKIRKNRFIEVIPINTGCLNQCTYCKTKQARGDLRSYPPQEIVKRAEQVIQEGVVEIWLTSEDTGTYGRDIGTSLPELLWAIVKILPDGVRLRVGMTNPPYIREHLKEMAAILNHPNVYRFLHVPVQAASNRVLYDMRRKYTQEEFREVVDYLQKNVPEMTIATDIICGFPTETEEDFQQTLDLIEEYKFPVVNISQFYPRHGTPAARLKRLPTIEVKRRSRAMTQLFSSYQTFQDQIGTIQRVLVTDIAHDGKHYVAHNISYHQVLVDGDESLMGKMVDVKIVSATKFSMSGEIIATSISKAPRRPSPPLRGALSQPKGDTCCGDKASCSGGTKKKDDCSTTATSAVVDSDVGRTEGGKKDVWLGEKVLKTVVLVALFSVGLILVWRILFW